MKTSVFWDITPCSPLKVLVYLGLFLDRSSFGICNSNKEYYLGCSSKINLPSSFKITDIRKE
jgi:hypothetical protein